LRAYDLAAYIGIIGATCVTFGNSLAANIIWSFTNPVMCYNLYKAGHIASARMFGVYCILAWSGVIRGVLWA